MTRLLHSPRTAFTAAVWVLTATATGCGDTVLLRPIIDTPPEDSPAYPYHGVDFLVLSIANAGDDLSLREVAVAIGDDLALPKTPFGSDLVVHLSALGGGAEAAYGRTCAVDVNGEDPLPEPHLYLSLSSSWGPGGQPIDGLRSGATGYALPDGSAVFVGGGLDTTGVERFDPIAARYQDLGITVAPRRGATLAALDDGRAVILGGSDDQDRPVDLLEVVDPRRPSVQSDDDTGVAVAEHATVTLLDGSVIIAGGRYRADDDPPGVPPVEATDRAWRLEVGAGATPGKPQPLQRTMNAARAGHTMTRLGDELGADVLVVGGRDASGQPVAEVELYRSLSRSFEPIGATLAQPRWGHTAVRMPGGFVLVLGGFKPGATVDPEPAGLVELYDPGLNRFVPFVAEEQIDLVAEGAGIIDHTVTLRPDGSALLVGGRDPAGQPTDAVFVISIDPLQIQVDIDMVPTAPLAVPRAGHSAIPLCDGTTLVVGGSQDASAERYNPASTGRR